MRQVEVVRRLVEDEEVDASPLQECERRAGAFARGEGGRGAQDVPGLQTELGQQRAHFGGLGVRHGGAERVQERFRAVEQRTGLVDLADEHT